MDYILELNEVSKKYAISDFSLDRVSFAVPLGTIMGFVGENGAGKTTTIGCILNTLHIDSGEIKIFGEKASDNNKELFEQIGVVYDGDNFPKHLSAEQFGRMARMSLIKSNSSHRHRSAASWNTSRNLMKSIHGDTAGWMIPASSIRLVTTR